jgi:histidine triad (HIT) family protein
MGQEEPVADCVFCVIGRGEGEAKYVYKDDKVVAIEDLRPVAPVHVLVIPAQHFDTVRDLKDAELMAHVFEVANKVADQRGITKDGYRLIFNYGPHGGQAVYHVHLHLIGGRYLAWPPG